MFGVLALAGVLPLACSSSDDAGSSGTTPTATTTPPAPTVAPEGGLPGSAGPADQTTNQFVHPTGDVTVGRDVFRFETFGNEGYWTQVLQLPQGMKEAGVTPLMALKLGLSVDIEKVPAALATAIAAELKTDLSPSHAPKLNDPATTEALVEANAILGVVARNVKTLNGTLDIDPTDVYAGESVGVSCAFCHSITDGSVFKPAAGARGGTIGKRVDGLTNHDLEVGKSVALAKHSVAFYPTLALQLTANGGKSLSRKGPGMGLISAAPTEIEVDAYLNDPVLYPIGMFDDAPDANGAPMHITPLFRGDLGAPWGSEGSIEKLHNFGNLVYTALLDPTDLTTVGGRKFLMERGGAAGIELADNYEGILATLGITKGGATGYPFVGRSTRADVTIGLAAGAKVEDSPIGMRVDETKLFAMNGYLNSLAAPAGVKTDAAAIARGRNEFRQSCTSCHNDDQSKFVPQDMAAYNATVELYSVAPKRPDLWSGYVGELVADRTSSGLAPVRNAPATFDDKLVVVDASNRGQPRGSAFPFLMDLARKPVFLHDDSVPSLDALLDPTKRAATDPHPFFVADAAKRADVIRFLESLDDQPLK